MVETDNNGDVKQREPNSTAMKINGDRQGPLTIVEDDMRRARDCTIWLFLVAGAGLVVAAAAFLAGAGLVAAAFLGVLAGAPVPV